MTKSLPEYPIATATILVGDKWKIQIMRELLIDQDNPKYFSDFKHHIIGISEVIKKRVSVRIYENRRLSENDKKMLLKLNF